MSSYDRIRTDLRDALWPDASKVVYNKNDGEKGYTTVPRTVSMICTLLRLISEKSRTEPSRVYLALWLRTRDHGMYEIMDPDELAQECGYVSVNRRRRSLHEALDQLEDLGFIRMKPKGARERAFVLLLHPNEAAKRYREEHPKQVPGWWWSLFEVRMNEIRATFKESAPDEHDRVPAKKKKTRRESGSRRAKHLDFEPPGDDSMKA